MERKNYDDYPVQFRGSYLFALMPLLIAAAGSILFFVVLGTFSLVNLAMACFVGLIVGSVFSKDMNEYWKGVVKGMASDICAILILIILVVGIFTQMMARAGVAEGFVWLGSEISMTGGLFVAFVFIACCVISMATGTSLGTVFSGFPIFYPAGVLLGADPIFLAGAILSGAIFGDHLSPISDTTIVSSTTQRFKSSGEGADIPGVVASRFKYAGIAALVAAVLYLIFGGGFGTSGQVAGAEVLAEFSNPSGLIMLVPVVVLLVVAAIKRNIFVAITVGTVVGVAVGLISGALSPADILVVNEGVAEGFLIAGITAKTGIVVYLIGIFGIMGVMRESGLLDRILYKLANSKMARTTKGVEWINSIGVMVTSLFIGSANGPALIIYGPLSDELARPKGIHPYRRANIIDSMVCSLPIVFPFTSLFIFVVLGTITGLIPSFDFLEPLSPFALAAVTFYPIILFVVMAVAIFTGWGMRYETADGGMTADPAEAATSDPSEEVAIPSTSSSKEGKEAKVTEKTEVK
ncbi:MAG: Na+/H+ antiporter NhaC family protein [Coriobacteriia bacterium]|nr:Na+/H+ antiporter NhaC family protein [Coriobacteriia bacterium]